MAEAAAFSACAAGPDVEQLVERKYPALPERWLDYRCFKCPIKDTQIIAMKSPLKKTFHNELLKKDSPAVISGKNYRGGIPREEEFTPAQCLELIERRCGFRLCVVIDLTGTDKHKYYNPQEFRSIGVKHHKIKCPGQIIPTQEIYEEFREVVTKYLADMGPKDLLAVHCTHGLNRTGYMVCRYLIEECKFGTEEAIREFNLARGHNIERRNFLQHLQEGCPSLSWEHSGRKDRRRPHTQRRELRGTGQGRRRTAADGQSIGFDIQERSLEEQRTCILGHQSNSGEHKTGYNSQLASCDQQQVTGHDKQISGPYRQRKDLDGLRFGAHMQRSGPDGQRSGAGEQKSDAGRQTSAAGRRRSGAGRRRSGAGRQRGGAGRQRGGAGRQRSGADRQRSDSNRKKCGCDMQSSDPDGQRSFNEQRIDSDRVQSGLDMVGTAPDRVQSGFDAVGTAPDRVQSGFDVVGTDLQRSGPIWQIRTTSDLEKQPTCPIQQPQNGST